MYCQIHAISITYFYKLHTYVCNTNMCDIIVVSKVIKTMREKSFVLFMDFK